MEAVPDVVTIRRALIQDAADLQANCFSMSTLEQVQSALVTDLAAMEFGQRIRLVATFAGQVIGNATLFRQSHTLKQHIGSIHDVVVSGLFQRRGIARQLFDQLTQEARILGLEILETSVRAGTDAEQVYRRLGFEEYGRLPRGLREPWGKQRVYDHIFF